MTRSYNHLKPWITSMCQQTGLSIWKLANRMVLGRATIYGWMSDAFRPDTDNLLKMCQVFANESGGQFKSEDLFAEALQLYTPHKEGRPYGSTSEKQLTTRGRK